MPLFFDHAKPCQSLSSGVVLKRIPPRLLGRPQRQFNSGSTISLMGLPIVMECTRQKKRAKKHDAAAADGDAEEEEEEEQRPRTLETDAARDDEGHGQ